MPIYRRSFHSQLALPLQQASKQAARFLQSKMINHTYVCAYRIGSSRKAGGQTDRCSCITWLQYIARAIDDGIRLFYKARRGRFSSVSSIQLNRKAFSVHESTQIDTDRPTARPQAGLFIQFIYACNWASFNRADRRIYIVAGLNEGSLLCT